MFVFIVSSGLDVEGTRAAFAMPPDLSAHMS